MSKKKSKWELRGKRLVMGKNCVSEVVKHAIERLVRVYTAKRDMQDPLLVLLREAGIPVHQVPPHELTEYVQSDSHQSYVAVLKEKPQTSLADFLAKPRERSLVLALDSINDPQNFGTLFRAAECFGADAVVWSKNRGCGLTPTVAKASVGASELVTGITVSNLAEAIRKFQEEGYQAVVADIDETAQSLGEFTFPDKTLLVVGSEGKGPRPLIKKLADAKVYIPMKGKIDSLNVSQATTVLLSKWSLSP